MKKIKVPLQNQQVSQSAVNSGGELVMRLMHSRTWAHLAHLSVSGPGAFEKHVAIGSYYEAIPDLIDRLVECAQGIYGQILNYPQVPFDTTMVDPLDYFTTLRTEIEQIAPQIKHPALDNIIAEILELLGAVCYKLKFLQ